MNKNHQIGNGLVFRALVGVIIGTVTLINLGVVIALGTIFALKISSIRNQKSNNKNR